jgi:hypothetical protein
MDRLGNLLTTREIQMGWESIIESYPNWWFGFIHNPDGHFVKGSVPTQTQNSSDGQELLLTLDVSVVPNDSGLIRASLMSKKRVEMLNVTVSAMETRRNRGNKKK